MFAVHQFRRYTTHTAWTILINSSSKISASWLLCSPPSDYEHTSPWNLFHNFSCGFMRLWRLTHWSHAGLHRPSVLLCSDCLTGLRDMCPSHLYLAFSLLSSDVIFKWGQQQSSKTDYDHKGCGLPVWFPAGEACAVEVKHITAF